MTTDLGLPTEKRSIAVGILSDTHGQLHPQVVRLLEGVDHLIHAGDVGSAEVLATLRRVAPLTVVRGNCDLEAWARDLPLRAEVTVGGVRILVGHVGRRLPTESHGSEILADHGFAVVVFGHSHLAFIEERDGVLYLNPGSAGPRRFGRPRTVARLEILPVSASRLEAGPGARPQISATILTVED